jgi:glycosyltransferase involved in cell wall biosynthesis
LEAIAAGATVVGTNHAGIPEVIAHEQTGLLVPERMTDELAKALIHALGDENLRSRCVALGRERIRRDFDAGKQAKILETIYDEVSRVAGP